MSLSAYNNSYFKLNNKITPEWLRVENFTQLKLILWDTALTTLVVIFVGDAFKAGGKYDWELTIIPIAILLISFSKYLIKKLATNKLSK